MFIILHSAFSEAEPGTTRPGCSSLLDIDDKPLGPLRAISLLPAQFLVDSTHQKFLVGPPLFQNFNELVSNLLRREIAQTWLWSIAVSFCHETSSV